MWLPLAWKLSVRACQVLMLLEMARAGSLAINKPDASTNTPSTSSTSASIATPSPTPTYISTSFSIPTSMHTSTLTPTPTSISTSTSFSTSISMHTSTLTSTSTSFYTPISTHTSTLTPTPTSISTSTSFSTSISMHTSTLTSISTSFSTPISTHTSTLTPTPTSNSFSTPNSTPISTPTPTPTSISTSTSLSSATSHSASISIPTSTSTSFSNSTPTSPSGYTPTSTSTSFSNSTPTSPSGFTPTSTSTSFSNSTPTSPSGYTPTSKPGNASKFIAAVYEHTPYMNFDRQIMLSRQEALNLMRKNLAVYKAETESAKQQGAEIIVFPEDGLYGYIFKRESVSPYLEEIPDPDTIPWSPCSDPGRFPDTEVQTALSCMAKHNQIYLVANMGDRVPCNSSLDPHCPADGRYQYNTDVAYGPDGTLLAKYHKRNLYFEYQFNKPESTVVSFDTPFGRVGMLTCFDLLFKDPAVTMVTEHNISIVAFPTAWMDALPLLPAVGYHSSFARGIGVNVLAANLHIPGLRFQGSGIFTPEGAASFYYDNHPSSPGKLLVSTIDVISPAHREGKHTMDEIDLSNLNKSVEFKSQLFHDIYTFRLLEEESGKLDVCQNEVCCSLEYEFALNNSYPNRDTFALGVFDGLHSHHSQYYFQICILVKCVNPDDRLTCGSATTVSSTKFKSFTMSGKFETEFVYPQVILSESGQLALADTSAWSFKNGTLQASGPGIDDTSLLSATLLGRHYSRDEGHWKTAIYKTRQGA